MAGTGKAPKPPEQRRTGHVPLRGDWVASPDVGWQHGPLPACPPRLVKAARETWDVWFTAWFAAHWTPADLPMLRQVIKLYNVTEKGSATAAERTELRQLSDSYGITPKGQQDRRWAPPKSDAPTVDPADDDPAAAASGRYGHLRDVTKAG